MDSNSIPEKRVREVRQSVSSLSSARHQNPSKMVPAGDRQSGTNMRIGYGSRADR